MPGMREANEVVGTTRAVSVPALRDASPSVRRPSHHSTSEDFPRLVRTARGVPSSSEQAAETDGLRTSRKGSGSRQAIDKGLPQVSRGAVPLPTTRRDIPCQGINEDL